MKMKTNPKLQKKSKDIDKYNFVKGEWRTCNPKPPSKFKRFNIKLSKYFTGLSDEMKDLVIKNKMYWKSLSFKQKIVVANLLITMTFLQKWVVIILAIYLIFAYYEK